MHLHRYSRALSYRMVRAWLNFVGTFCQVHFLNDPCDWQRPKSKQSVSIENGISSLWRMQEKSRWLRLALASDDNDISVACGAWHGFANDVELNKYFSISTDASHCVDRMDIPASFNHASVTLAYTFHLLPAAAPHVPHHLCLRPNHRYHFHRRSLPAARSDLSLFSCNLSHGSPPTVSLCVHSFIRGWPLEEISYKTVIL